MGRWDWGQILTPALYFLLFGVGLTFAHTGLQGDRGLAALRKAEALEAKLLTELDLLKDQRRDARNKVHRLDESFLDLDLLDERARAVLGYIGPNEIVLP